MMEFLSNNTGNTIQDKAIEIIEKNEKLTILSPYLSNNKAIEKILQKDFFELTLIINFDSKTLVQKAVDLSTLKKLLDKKHIIKVNNKLHSKIYFSSDYIILGSANFTQNGLSERQESCIMFSKKFSPHLFNECETYCKKILDESPLITDVIDFTDEFISNILGIREDWCKLEGNKTNKLLNIFNNHKIKENNGFDLLSEKKSLTKSRIAYDLKYNYPKTLDELEPELKFYHIN